MQQTTFVRNIMAGFLFKFLKSRSLKKPNIAYSPMALVSIRKMFADFGVADVSGSCWVSSSPTSKLVCFDCFNWSIYLVTKTGFHSTGAWPLNTTTSPGAWSRSGEIQLLLLRSPGNWHHPPSWIHPPLSSIILAWDLSDGQLLHHHLAGSKNILLVFVVCHNQCKCGFLGWGLMGSGRRSWAMRGYPQASFLEKKTVQVVDPSNECHMECQPLQTAFVGWYVQKP